MPSITLNAATLRARTVTVMVLVLATTIWLLPSVPARGNPPETQVREVSLTGWSSTVAPSTGLRALAADTTTWRTAAPVPAGDAVLVGLDWGGSEDVEVQLRSSRGTEWSEWTDVHPMGEEAPDPGTAEAERADTTVSDPVWIGPSDLIEVRVQGGTPDVRVQLVDVVGGDGLGYVAPEDLRRPGAARAAEVQPPIRTRASWGANESARKHVPIEMKELRFAVVHHTAGTNSYTAEEADDVIRAIYAYHLRNGWDDIAYNFLIDRFGRIWEGRAGGITKAIMGGHAAGWNGGSMGVSLMGNFQGTEPPAVAMEALEDLTAWKMDIHHVDPFGTTQEIAGGGRSNRHAAGDRVTLPTIIGHRRTNNTSCPGSNVYAHVIGEGERLSLAERIDGQGHPKAYGGQPAHREQPQIGVRPTWDVDFSRLVDWRMEITDAKGALVRSTAGVRADALELTWDLHDASGSLVEPGTYTAKLSGTDDSGGAITPVVTELEVTPPVERRGGATRIETAVELSRWSFTDATRVVIASAEAYPDALVASPLAASLGSPVLLVPSGGAPSPVLDEIKRLHATSAYIVGGTARISEQVERDLKKAGITYIKRLSGPTRYETAEKVARFVIEREGSDEVLMALGEHADEARAYTDALTAGAYGALFDLPLVLTQPGALPAATEHVLDDLNASTLRIVDTANGISDAVKSRAASVGGSKITQFNGRDRYETSRLAAEGVLARWRDEVAKSGPSPYFDPTGFEVVAASGENWPDALGAAAAAAERDVPFLLVAPDRLGRSAGVERFLRDHAGTLAHVIVSGRSAAVSDRTISDIESIARSAGPHREPRETWAPAPGAGTQPATLPLPTASPSPAPDSSKH